jgi:hypothetical protein
VSGSTRQNAQPKVIHTKLPRTHFWTIPIVRSQEWVGLADALVHRYYPTNSVAYFKSASYLQALSGKFFEIWAVFCQVNNAKRNHY